MSKTDEKRISLEYGVKGFRGVRRYAERMDSISQTALNRLWVLNFWAAHGLAAAVGALGVSHRTLYGWKQAYGDAGSNMAALNSQSRAPVNRDKVQDWDSRVLAHLV